MLHVFVGVRVQPDAELAASLQSTVFGPLAERKAVDAVKAHNLHMHAALCSSSARADAPASPFEARLAS